MIKVVDNEKSIFVSFKNKDNKQLSGKLLTYEITGEACVQIGSDRVWIPFSRLSKASRNQLIDTAVKNTVASFVLKDPKVMIVITMLVLIFFSYYYMRFSG